MVGLPFPFGTDSVNLIWKMENDSKDLDGKTCDWLHLGLDMYCFALLLYLI